jgi:hypothetical protein
VGVASNDDASSKRPLWMLSAAELSTAYANGLTPTDVIAATLDRIDKVNPSARRTSSPPTSPSSRPCCRNCAQLLGVSVSGFMTEEADNPEQIAFAL